MKKSFVLSMLVLTTGCSFHARSPSEYRDATATLLQTKSADVRLATTRPSKPRPDSPVR